MKFYDCVTAPSPRRVRIFLAEKGLSVPTVQVDLRNGEQFTPAFRALNPDCMVPVLELDSGAAITDIFAICHSWVEGQSLARSCIPRTDSGARRARASSASAFLCMARCALGRP